LEEGSELLETQKEALITFWKALPGKIFSFYETEKTTSSRLQLARARYIGSNNTTRFLKILICWVRTEGRFDWAVVEGAFCTLRAGDKGGRNPRRIFFFSAFIRHYGGAAAARTAETQCRSHAL
jgi:hypothetical protein